MAVSKYKIIEKKNLWFTISFIVIFSGLSVMGARFFQSKPLLNYGIDFIGGSSLLLKFDQLNQLHSNNTSATKKEINLGFINELRNFLLRDNLEKSTIQITQEKEVMIKTHLLNNAESDSLLRSLKKNFGTIEVLEIDFIGPSIGEELKQKSIWIVLVVSIALLLYITWRFEVAFGLAALAALLHDALITISFAAFLNIEIDTAFIAALLTVLGYSINDTIVVFDRIRENLKLLKKQNLPMIDLANISLNQTIARTINTSLTTIAVIVSLLVLGGTTIKPFCTVLLIGVIAGTYSSVFVASPLLVTFNKSTDFVSDEEE